MVSHKYAEKGKTVEMTKQEKIDCITKEIQDLERYTIKTDEEIIQHYNLFRQRREAKIKILYMIREMLLSGEEK